MFTIDTTKTTAAPSRWHVERAGSAVEFEARTFWGLVPVRGRFDRFNGSYDVGPDGQTIELLVDAESVDTGNPTRDIHLRSADFFDITEHPLVRFTSSTVRDAGYGLLHVEGLLEAAGTVVPLGFDATVRLLDPGHLEMEMRTTVDHRRFGMHRGPLRMIRPPATVHVKVRLTEPALTGEEA